MKYLLPISLLATTMMAVPTSALAQATPPAVIVVVDTDRIFRDCTACKAAQTQLQGMITSARTRAQQLNQPLQTEVGSIQQAEAALNNQTGAARTAAETALTTRVQQFQARQNSAQQEVARLEQNIQSTQANVLRQINDRLNPIYATAMKSHGANLALEASATLAHSNTINITDEVLAALNKQLPSVSVTPLPAQPAAASPRPATTTPKPKPATTPKGR